MDEASFTSMLLKFKCPESFSASMSGCVEKTGASHRIQSPWLGSAEALSTFVMHTDFQLPK